MSARTITLAATAGLIVLALSGCGGQPVAAPETAERTPSASPTTPRPTPGVEVPVAAATPAPPRQSVPPVRLTLDAIAVDIPVTPVGVEEGGFMELNEDPAVGGWYRFGADPTSDDGNIVISAHVDAPDYPLGPLSRLRELSGGETVTVVDDAGTTHRYTIDSVTYYPKEELPVNEVFARSGTDKLVIITCGGEFDSSTGRYADNVVAVASPEGRR
jgi:hypothetical protein